MATGIDKIRQKLYEQKNRVGLVGGKITVNEYDDSKENFSASINSKGWDITLNVRKGFQPIQDRRQRAYARVKKIEDGLETMLLHVGGLHEPAHWELPFGSERGCPYDVYNHDKILESVKNALPTDKKTHAGYVTNAFEDMIINPRCREFNGDFSGQVLFWDWQGIETRQKGKEGFTPFYEAFVKLNMHLFGDNTDKALLKRHYTQDGKVDEAVNKTIRDLKLPQNISDTRVLFDRNRWVYMAGVFTKNLSDLLDVAPTERLSAFSSEGTGEPSEGEESEGKPQSGNGIEKKAGTRDGKEEISYGRYAGNDEQSPNFTSFEQLDSLYRRLAKAIPVNVEVMSKRSGLEIAPLTFRPFDEEKDDPRRIKASKLYATDEGLRFGYPNIPLTIEAKAKIQRRSFPDFKMIMIDNSGSMRLNPQNETDSSGGPKNIGNTNFIPWGDNSKYHFALLGHYGIENFLQRQQIAQYISHGLSLFSSQTRYKESGFQGLDEVRRFALNPDWGSTNIDAKSIGNALKGRESFVLSLSDGEIGNWSSEREEVRKLAEKNYFAHIQIGEETGFTNDLQSWGVPVFYVTKGEDLSKLMVDVTKKTYDNFTHGAK